MRRTRAVIAVLALGLLGSLVVAPAASAKGNGHHIDCAKVAARIAKLQERQASAAGVHGPRATGRLAHIDRKIARAQAACI